MNEWVNACMNEGVNAAVVASQGSPWSRGSWVDLLNSKWFFHLKLLKVNVNLFFWSWCTILVTQRLERSARVFGTRRIHRREVLMSMHYPHQTNERTNQPTDQWMNELISIIEWINERIKFHSTGHISAADGGSSSGNGQRSGAGGASGAGVLSGGVGAADVSAALVSVVSGVSEMLPGPLHDLVEPQRSFASVSNRYLVCLPSGNCSLHFYLLCEYLIICPCLIGSVKLMNATVNV
jgi:hypothetical protein